MRKRVGYIRVSTRKQCVDRQLDGLAGLCDEMHVEYISGASKRRPVFDAIVKILNAGDALIVWAVDRAFRSAIDAVTQAEKLRARGINFEIISRRVDTTTAEGFLAYWTMCGYAEYDRRIIVTRTLEGLAAARRRGKRLGRPPKLSDVDLDNARRAIAERSATYASLARRYGIAPWSLSRALKRETMRPLNEKPIDVNGAIRP